MKTHNTPLQLLGNITPEQFFAEYWHKKPCLIRQAIPNFEALFTPKELFAMAKRDDVESRLITFFDQHWEMKHGPQSRIPTAKKKDWTLLVQGVNLHDAKADALMQQFRFIPDARLDDLMISYAEEGGGVGPHFDSYDVFLLQAHGQRRWQISAQKDLSLVEGMPLKILSNFQAEQEFILEPGDMLYLPPHYAHDGIALGECMTYSIGFRAPAYQELGESFLQFMIDTIDLPERYADPELKAQELAAEIPSALIDKITKKLKSIQFSDEDMHIFIGEYFTEPKTNVFFDGPKKALAPEKFVKAALKQGIRLSLKTRMLHKGQHMFINGESFVVGEEDKAILCTLAEQRQLTPDQVQNSSDDVLEAFCIWYEDGWVDLIQ
jgi:50S ribosomal protein L16 3-hydroxylase